MRTSERVENVQRAMCGRAPLDKVSAKSQELFYFVRSKQYTVLQNVGKMLRTLGNDML